MLRLVRADVGAEPTAVTRYSPEAFELSLPLILGALRQNWRLIAGIALLAVAAAVFFILSVEPRYTASAEVLVDTGENSSLRQQVQPQTDSATVESQAEVLQSGVIARTVIEKLNLTTDPEFATTGSASADDPEQQALESYQRKLKVKRVGSTYAIEVLFTSRSPERAAQVANAIADAYLDFQLETRYQATARATQWLGNRILELKDKAQRAEQALHGSQESNVDTKTGDPTAPSLNLRPSEQARYSALEKAAETARNVYERFLQRSGELQTRMLATQEQAFPIANAAVISAAVVPTRKSFPKSALIIFGALAGGVAVGCGIAVFRANAMRVFRTYHDVHTFAGSRCLGIVPFVEGKTTEPLSRRAPQANGHTLSLDLGLSRYVLEEPFSRMAEVLRTVKTSIDSYASIQNPKVIAFTSALPLEGKTLLSINLAMMIAYAGHKTLFIDGSMRNPEASADIAPDAKLGLADVLLGGFQPKDVIWTDTVSGLETIVNRAGEQLANSAELLCSPAMGQLLSWARGVYDFVVVDLAPILPLADVRAAGHLVDAFILVVEWNATSHDVVSESLDCAEVVKQRLLGVLLNKASVSAIEKAESYKGQPVRGFFR